MKTRLTRSDRFHVKFCVVHAIAWVIFICSMFGQPIPTNQPPIKSKLIAVKKSVPLSGKPAAQLISHPKPYTNAPPKLLLLSRGPSPYDDYANVDTEVEATADLSGNLKFVRVRAEHTNRFTFVNNGTNQYWRMKFGFNTN